MDFKVWEVIAVLAYKSRELIKTDKIIGLLTEPLYEQKLILTEKDKPFQE